MDPANLFFGLPLILFGGGLLWMAGESIRAARRATTWPAHTATVLASGVSTIGLYRTFPAGGVAK